MDFYALSSCSSLSLVFLTIPQTVGSINLITTIIRMRLQACPATACRSSCAARAPLLLHQEIVVHTGDTLHCPRRALGTLALFG
jgi:hypothetical protein